VANILHNSIALAKSKRETSVALPQKSEPSFALAEKNDLQIIHPAFSSVMTNISTTQNNLPKHEKPLFK